MIFNQYDTDTRDQTITNGPRILLKYFYDFSELLKWSILDNTADKMVWIVVARLLNAS